MESATNQTINYTLTRTFSFGTTKWNDLKTDVFTGVEDTYGNLNVPEEFIEILQGVESHTDVDNVSLKLTSVGTYTYKLEIGSLVRTWSVVVKEFPTLLLENAYLGTEDEIDLGTKIGLFNSREAQEDGIQYVLVIEERDDTNLEGTTVGSDFIADNPFEELGYLYLQVKAVNLPAGKIYFQVYDTDEAPTLADLTDKEVSFNTVTGIALIKIEDSFNSLFDNDDYDYVYVHLYDSNRNPIGYLALYVVVNEVYNLD
jgi:hypothetical protein